MLYFVYHHMRKHDDDNYEKLGLMLGTYWDENTLNGLLNSSEDGELPKQFILPLTQVLDPELKDKLRPRYMVGGEELKPGEEKPENLMEMNPDEFLAMMGRGKRTAPEANKDE